MPSLTGFIQRCGFDVSLTPILDMSNLIELAVELGLPIKV
jgi:hypothetical protein